ncbi:hypothetical protein [Piscinibacter sp.]|uniref:hypothetical protein n=1 Tax=Piscinibacter sp. TaxID=1903157 RepID=UPI002BDDC5D6|nr:hypothetical protein [Albitalea sp.]HUG25722.1 hypothetical protein [Albitalea sp.]
MNRSLRVSLWAVAGLLTACGGGGGGGTPSPPPAPAPAPAPAPSPEGFDLGAAWRNFLTVTNRWDVTGTADNGSDYTITLSTAAGGDQTFSGVTYATTETTALWTVESLPFARIESVTYYDEATHIAVGTSTIVNADPEKCSAVVSMTLPPADAEVGDSGELQQLEDLDGCANNSAQTGTSTTTWSLEEHADVTFFCQNTEARDMANAVLVNESTCIEVAQDGTLGDKARVHVEQPAFTLLATN